MGRKNKGHSKAADGAAKDDEHQHEAGDRSQGEHTARTAPPPPGEEETMDRVGTTDSVAFTPEEMMHDKQAPLQKNHREDRGRAANAAARKAEKDAHSEDDSEEVEEGEWEDYSSGDSSGEDSSLEGDDWEDEYTDDSASGSDAWDDYPAALHFDERQIVDGDIVTLAPASQRGRLRSELSDMTGTPVSWLVKQPRGFGRVGESVPPFGKEHAVNVDWYRPRNIPLDDTHFEGTSYATEVRDIHLVVQERGDLEAGDVVRSIAHKDGGLISHIAKDVWAAPSGLHNFDPKFFDLSSRSVPQEGSSDDDAEWEETSPVNPAKGKKASKRKPMSKKRRKKSAGGMPFAPYGKVYHGKQQDFIPLCPLMTDIFVQSRKDATLFGFVRKIDCDLLVRDNNGDVWTVLGCDGYAIDQIDAQDAENFYESEWTAEEGKVPTYICLTNPASEDPQVLHFRVLLPIPRCIQYVTEAGVQQSMDVLEHKPLIINNFAPGCVGAGSYGFDVSCARSSFFKPSQEISYPKDGLQSDDSVLFVSAEDYSDFYIRLWQLGRSPGETSVVEGKVDVNSTGLLWRSQMVELLPYFTSIAFVERLKIHTSVTWQDGVATKIPKSLSLAPSMRYDYLEDGMDFDMVEVFPTDLVVPTSIMAMTLKSRIQNTEEEDNAVLAGDKLLTPLVSESLCSRYDFHPMYPVIETELVCGDYVTPRKQEDVYETTASGPPFPDPVFVGVLRKKVGAEKTSQELEAVPDHFDAESQYVVDWYLQRQKTLRMPKKDDQGEILPILEPLDDAVLATIIKGPNDILDIPPGHTGEVIGMLSDGRVRVRWPDGSHTIAYRHEVSVVRSPGEDDEEIANVPTAGDDGDDSDVEDADLAEALRVSLLSAQAEAAANAAAPPSVEGIASAGLAVASGVMDRTWQFIKDKVPALGGMTSNGRDVHVDPSEALDPEEEPEDIPSITSPSLQPQVVQGSFTMYPLFSRHIHMQNADKFKPLNPAKFFRRVHQELKILRTSLPPGVYVKACESHAHLLKFAIEGPMHTPYYQSLLCFDLELPVTYPEQPPNIVFHSKNLKLNPNLYEDGHICLSLLGTWEGTDPGENWNPETSNILQVVVSIQGLILVKEPFYNEAGFDEKVGSVTARRQSRQYNERVCLTKLQHLMDMADSNGVPDWSFEFREQYLRVVPLMLRRARQYIRLSKAEHAKNTELTSSPKKKKAAAGTSTPSDDDGDDDTSSAPLINSDGLVMPLSIAFMTTLGNYLEVVESQYQRLRPVWVAEGEAYSLPHLDDEGNQVEDPRTECETTRPTDPPTATAAPPEEDEK